MVMKRAGIMSRKIELKQNWQFGWQWLIGLVLLMGLPLAHAQEAVSGEANALEAVDVSSLPGNRVQIKFSMANPAPEPLSFTIDNPARIALDFPATSNKLAKRTTSIGVGVARSVSVVEARGRTRVVLNLVRLVPYETRVEGNSVYVILESVGAAQSMATPPVDKDPTVFASREISASHGIQSVDFRRGEKGEARIVVELSDSGTNVNVREQGGKLAIDFIDANLPEELEQRLDVTDFATPVTLIDVFRQGNNVRMVVSAQGRFEHMAYQSGNLLTIEVKESADPDLKELARAGDERAFGGERLSLNFQNIEVRAVLQLIADFTGMNLVTSDTVTGSVTLRLQNVPWDQALDIILKTKGLAMREVGNVMYIGPAEEVAAREKQELEAKKQIKELEPLFSEMIQINYAKAADIAALVKGKENSLMSERGNVAIDERTNTLLIQDTADKLEEVHKLISTLDIPIRQVLIESRIVIANSGFGRDLGVRFGVSRETPGVDGDKMVFSGSLAATDSYMTTDNSTDPTAPSRFNVDLPVAAAGSIGFSLAKLPFGTLVDLELSAMQAENKGEVVSTPRVITSNQQTAFIEQGVEIPYQEASSSGATSVSFKKAVLRLEVTPQITPDDRIIMDLNINKDSVGQIYLGTPSINTREIKTQVLVENGETVVLGGVYEQEETNDVIKVPFLGDLPVLGALFRQTRKSDGKEELLIFITPKIIKEGLSIN
jgi:type IV pilus assembly protein PilQ